MFFFCPENAVKDDARVKRATGLCKQMVGVFSHSWKKKSALKQAQQESNLPEHSLITECPTRWGSRQKMIGRVLEQSKALSQVLSEDKKTRHLVPTWQDTDVLESINNALGPLQEFTDALSGEAYVSVSYLKPVLHLLRTSTPDWKWCWHKSYQGNQNKSSWLHWRQIQRPSHTGATGHYLFPWS